MNLDETDELDWGWRQWLFGVNRGASTVHYANLTRGVACAPKNARLCRIQSTQCEAKQWERVLMSVPDELIATVALGQFVVIHDFSERERETRAMWQGLTLARIMMELRWFGELRGKYGSSRGGNSKIQYLRNVASEQSEHVRRKYDYFRDLLEVNDTTYLGLVSCVAGSANGSTCQYSSRTTPTRSVDRPPSTVW